MRRALNLLKPRNWLTSRRRSLIVDGSSYKSPDDNDIKYLRGILGENGVQTEDLEGYNEDWLRMHKGRFAADAADLSVEVTLINPTVTIGSSTAVMFPRTTQEVSSILSYCSSKILPIVIQGGNTSLVAGSVPTKNEMVLSMQRMNRVVSFDETIGVLQCQSGCVLQTLEEYVDTRGYIMPYDLGAKGSCQIGGNVATNAGGVRFIRYGSLHGNVLGLECVLANGQVLNLMSSLRKDNTGYDLKQLFIGSEGTLGVITKVAILCALKPKHRTVALLAVERFDNVLEVFRCVRKHLSEYVSAFELIDLVSMNAVTENLRLSPPLGSNPFYTLIELSANDSDHMEKRLEMTIEKLMSDKLVVDGTYSSDVGTMLKLWGFRERIAEALLIDGYCYKYDVSLPLNHFYELVDVMRQRLGNSKALRVCGYGHLGDCNLHLNITSKKFEESILSAIEPLVYEWISERKGSISAEHGLGLKKRNCIHYSKAPEAVALMLKFKLMLDPNQILNPGKTLPG